MTEKYDIITEMQVSIVSIMCMAVSAIVSIGLPVVLFIIFRKQYGAKWLPMIIGAAAFIIFALVLERSIHLFVFARVALKEKPLLYIVYGIFMAGIFEETARFISFTLLKRKYEGIGTGLSYGVGHGGIEAVILAGFAMINNIVFSIMLNMGNIEAITGKLQGEALEQLSIQMNALVTTAPYMFLVSGLERIAAIGIQISLSIMVFYSVYAKRKIWLFPLAIVSHAIIDIPAAAFQVGVLKNVFLVEGLVCICAVMLILSSIYMHKRLREAS